MLFWGSLGRPSGSPRAAEGPRRQEPGRGGRASRRKRDEAPRRTWGYSAKAASSSRAAAAAWICAYRSVLIGSDADSGAANGYGLVLAMLCGIGRVGSLFVFPLLLLAASAAASAASATASPPARPTRTRQSAAWAPDAGGAPVAPPG